MSRPRLGTVVAAFGRHYDVELADGGTTTGYPRAKKSQLSCGDRVSLNSDGQITTIEERSTLLYRSDTYRQKLLAANVDQLILVVATSPSFNDALLSRALVAAESQHIRSLIVLNKTDLVELVPSARSALRPFAALGYPIIELAARHDASELLPYLEGHTSIFVGQSGMGKSTITNALIPTALASTREISTALDAGKHTTTCARMYNVGKVTDGRLIDSPGLQEFGLAHLTFGQVEDGFVEFRPWMGKCKFRDCRHGHERDCAIKQAVSDGIIHPRRLEHFHQLTAR